MSSSTFDRQRLMDLIREHALKFGDFTLASGKKASYYLDCRKLTLDSEGANVIAAGILETRSETTYPTQSAAWRSAPTQSPPP